MDAAGEEGLYSLPYELIVKIFSELTLQELLNVSLVSRRLHYASQEPTLWVKLFESTGGLRLNPDLRRRIVATRTPPGVWHRREWLPGPAATLQPPATRSPWTLPYQIKSYVEGFLWPSSEKITQNLAAEVIVNADTDEQEAKDSDDRIKVHYPTLLRSRQYIEEEMKLCGPHRIYDPANPLGNYPYSGEVGPDPVDDEQVFVRPEASEDVYPNYVFMGEEHEAKVYTVRVHGQWLLSGSRDKTFHIWRLPSLPIDGSMPIWTPRLVHVHYAHSASIICIDFEVETGMVVTGSSDTTACVWEVEWGHGDDSKWEGVQARQVATLTRHTKTVSGVALAKDHIITCSHDGHIHIYDRSSIRSSQPTLVHDIAPLMGSTPPLGLALSPSGQAIVAGCPALTYINLSTGLRYEADDLITGRVTCADWTAGMWAAWADGQVQAFERTRSGSRSYMSAVRNGDIEVRAGKVSPVLRMAFSADVQGNIWSSELWPPPGRPPSTKRYHFEDTPIFGLDRDSVYMCLAAGNKIAVITYGVGKPYAMLLKEVRQM